MLCSALANTIAKSLKASQKHCRPKVLTLSNTIFSLHCISKATKKMFHGFIDCRVPQCSGTLCHLKFSYLSTSTMFFWTIFHARDCNQLRQKLMQLNYSAKNLILLIESHQESDVPQLYWQQNNRVTIWHLYLIWSAIYINSILSDYISCQQLQAAQGMTDATELLGEPFTPFQNNSKFSLNLQPFNPQP